MISIVHILSSTVPKDEEEIVDTKELATFPGYELLSYRERKVNIETLLTYKEPNRITADNTFFLLLSVRRFTCQVSSKTMKKYLKLSSAVSA